MARTATTKRRPNAKRVAIVTGGGTGLGRDAANTLVDDGFTVAVIGRRAGRLKPRRGEKLHPYVCDIADLKQVKQTVKSVLADFGRIDVLVNNAGVVRRQTYDKVTQEAIAYTMGINLYGTMNFSLACIPALKKTKGSIINISSSLSCRPGFGHMVYATSKGGVDAFSKSLALELGPFGVRVNIISPALVRSEIYFPEGVSRKDYEADLKQRNSRYPLGRTGEPDDVSELVSFLASEKSSWMTGVLIPIDGGAALGFMGPEIVHHGRAGRSGRARRTKAG